MQTVEDKTVISGLRWYASDQYRLITVGGVGGDFSQTGAWTALHILQHPPVAEAVGAVFIYTRVTPELYLTYTLQYSVIRPAW